VPYEALHEKEVTYMEKNKVAKTATERVSWKPNKLPALGLPVMLCWKVLREGPTKPKKSATQG